MSRAGELDLEAIKARLAKFEGPHPTRDHATEYCKLCVHARADLTALVAEVEALREALRDIESRCCMQFACEEEFWCKKDGSEHSVHCPVTVARAALRGKP